MCYQNPGDQNGCLLLQEFKVNVDKEIGRKCFRNEAFPRRGPWVVHLVRRGVGEDLTLAGRKHHAIMDALQLGLSTNLLLDFYMSNP